MIMVNDQAAGTCLSNKPDISEDTKMIHSNQQASLNNYSRMIPLVIVSVVYS